jgi:biofilm PGA synthesis N-glycosyltransferase PgaC
MYSASAIIALIVSIILLDYLMKLSKWRKRGVPPLPPLVEEEKEISIVVIVPFRNEARHLPELLHDLSEQTMACPIVFVDDHSEDQSKSIIENYLNHHPHWHCLDAVGEGKKAAIRTAIVSTPATYLITLDADVHVSKRWFEELSDFLIRVKPILAVLPVKLVNDHSVLGRLQSAEWNMISALTAGSALAGEAVLCNGAHLAFHRDLVTETLPSEHSVSSGDDMFLLEKAKRIGPVYYYWTDGLSVSTQGASSWRTFFTQRIRWAGKVRRLKDRHIVGFGIRTLLVQTFQLLLPLYLWYYPEMIWFALGWVYIKWSAELGFTYNYCRVVNMRWSFISSWVVVIVYPLYSILVAAISVVYRPKWKGRTIKQ